MNKYKSNYFIFIYFILLTITYDKKNGFILKLILILMLIHYCIYK